jgi:hypothetical protein
VGANPPKRPPARHHKPSQLRSGQQYTPHAPGGQKASPTGTELATFINTFRCEPSNQDEVVRINMDIIDQVASMSPGFISATVHRSTDGTRVFN